MWTWKCSPTNREGETNLYQIPNLNPRFYTPLSGALLLKKGKMCIWKSKGYIVSQLVYLTSECSSVELWWQTALQSLHGIVALGTTHDVYCHIPLPHAWMRPWHILTRITWNLGRVKCGRSQPAFRQSRSTGRIRICLPQSPRMPRGPSCLYKRGKFSLWFYNLLP